MATKRTIKPAATTETAGRIALAKAGTRVTVNTDEQAARLERAGFGRVARQPEAPGGDRPKPAGRPAQEE